MVLLRFAPSPTGFLHLGGLRTALYNYLYARKLGGKWILRVEDTDATRYVPGSVENIQESLNWAGLDYDYGPSKGGPHGPYFQSERLDLYRWYSKKLLDSGHAYRCFCSADTLASTRERLARTGSNETYDKACLHLTDEEVARRVKAGDKHVIRLNDSTMPDRPPGHDIVFGTWKENHGSLPTDPILLKSDLYPTYHLASVVDDHEMGITHVIRGEEWLPSLPLHLDLYACLSLPPPEFAHIPILLKADGTKMSKRSGDAQVIDYIKHGYEPGAILNWLVLAGWGAKHEKPSDAPVSSAPDHARAGAKLKSEDAFLPDSTSIMTLPEMIEKFDLHTLTHRRSILDQVKLKYLNRHHLLQRMSTPEGLDSIVAQLYAYVQETYPASEYATEEYVRKLIPTINVVTFEHFKESMPIFFIEPDLYTSEAQGMVGGMNNATYKAVLQKMISLIENPGLVWEHDQLEIEMRATGRDGPWTPKVIMTVMRHALTGVKAGPAVADIMHVLGRERTLRRLRKASEEDVVKSWRSWHGKSEHAKLPVR
ncbi:glutamyl-tRNA synthetase [Neolentinus lepideus HHB14362 ss-1]|uniref:glutamate--tRNA ligase n=1 Tax=Neolentinus lepideus HHB14362 ss-1 TaxID=1314782 RepID=A0A165S496_9AGAM|nr:glutamyl-tRNA synthetase [Neolentinus lepideus HHB14362 ss-1]